MKVMITGAAGFIGSQLAHRLWKDGAELILIDNFSYGSNDNLTFEDHSFVDEIIKIDIRDRKAMEEIFNPRMKQASSLTKLFKALNNTYIQDVFEQMNEQERSKGVSA